MKPPFPNSYWVGSDFLAGHYPDQEQGEVAALVATGVTRFLDLTEPGEREPYASSLPEGLVHRRLSIPDFSVPTVADMRAILDRLDALLQEGHRVYLHCYGGLGRTGTVVGCFLVRHGCSGDEALSRIRALRLAAGCSPHSPETDAQRTMVRSWADLKP